MSAADRRAGPSAPVLDWPRYAREHPEASPNPCDGAGHDHPDDPRCALAGWFLSRAARPGRSLRLVTLTFDPKRLYRGSDPRLPRTFVGRQAATRAIDDWWREGVRPADPAADALVGLEAHKSGARHAHALLGLDDEVQWRRAWAYWFDRFGASQGWRAPVAVAQAAAMYAAKYPTKELGVYGVVYGGGRLVVA